MSSVGSLGEGSLGIGSLGVGSLGVGSLNVQEPILVGTIPNVEGNNGVAITAYSTIQNIKYASTYTLQNAPSWLSVGSSGELYGTPDAVATTNGVTVTGTNSIDNVVSNTFDVIIT